jgi:hypothetical protein
MRTIPFIFLGVTFFAAVAISGCVSETPLLNQHFGDAVNAAKAQQTIHPEASQNKNPVAGLDGQAAKGAVDLYQKSFVQPPVTSSTMNIGTSSDTGTAATQ